VPCITPQLAPFRSRSSRVIVRVRHSFIGDARKGCALGAIYGTVPSIPDIKLGATTRVGVVTFHGHEVRASTLARWRSR
jgi:hypothetical protein